MKKLLLLLSFCYAFNSYGAVTTYDYVMSRWVDTMISIQGMPGTTTISLLSKDDTTVKDIPIGFTFKYCGVDYLTLSASSNGWISLANTSVWAYPSFYNVTAGHMSTLGGGVGFLMPFWDDLSATFAGSTSPPIPPAPTATAYCRIDGILPNRVFTFQWGTPVIPWHSYLGTGDATFQVKLYETSGVIEFVYGPGTFSAKTATIGIANDAISNFRTLSSADAFSSMVGPTWNYLIDTVPARNTIIQWAPPCPDTPMSSIYVPDSMVCAGQTITLSNPDTIGGGVWWTSSASVATVGSAAGMDTVGIVTGVAAGVVNISYKLNPSCFSVLRVTVNPLPDTITGNASMCEGATRTYTCSPPGGTWSSSNTAVGTVSLSGVFGGVTAGTTTLSYTDTAHDCSRTLVVTVNPAPVITGYREACIGDTTVLSCSITGGTWSSSNIARATVDGYGNVIGVTLGSVIITYTAPGGCIDTMPMTIIIPCNIGVKHVADEDNTVRIFPQPNNGDFYLVMPVTASVAVSITDMYGRVLVSRTVDAVKSNRIRFDESHNLPPGNYVIKMVAGAEAYVGKMTVIR